MIFHIKGKETDYICKKFDTSLHHFVGTDKNVGRNFLNGENVNKLINNAHVRHIGMKQGRQLFFVYFFSLGNDQPGVNDKNSKLKREIQKCRGIVFDFSLTEITMND